MGRGEEGGRGDDGDEAEAGWEGASAAAMKTEAEAVAAEAVAAEAVAAEVGDADVAEGWVGLSLLTGSSGASAKLRIMRHSWQGSSSGSSRQW